MSAHGLETAGGGNGRQVGYVIKPGYKQVTVGVIPTDWEYVSFEQLYSEPSRNGIYKTSEFHGRGTRIVNMGEMFGYEFIGPQEMSHVALSRQELSVSGLQQGDLLFGRRSVVPAGAGKCSMVIHLDEPLTFESSIIRVRLNTAVSDPRYYYYFFASTYGRSTVETIVSGTNVKGIRASELRELVVPQPTLVEQEAIAGALGDADALVESLERLLAKKRNLKQAAMQQLLTGKKRLPGFDGEWEEFNVSDVLQRSFSGPSPTCEERNIRGSEWGVLKTTAITWQNGWDWTKHKTLPKAFWNQPESEVRCGDVLVTKAGPRHRVGVTACVDFVPERILPSGKMIALRPITSKVIGRMLAAAIASPASQEYLDQRTTGMAEAQVNFENDNLLDTPIKLPTMAEQTAIVEVLTDMDAEIYAIEAKINKARQIKAGMMQELLTGKTRLV